LPPACEQKGKLTCRQSIGRSDFASPFLDVLASTGTDFTGNPVNQELLD